MFEFRVGSLLTPGDMALNLGVIEDDLSKYDSSRWFSTKKSLHTIGVHCGGQRAPPISPVQFDEMMDEKMGDGGPAIQFTVEADRAVIKGLYAKTFECIVGRACEFDWKGLGWAFELRDLLPVLTAAPMLQIVNLMDNKLRGEIPVEMLRMKAKGCKIQLLRNDPGFTLPSNIGELAGDSTQLDLNLNNCSLHGAC